MEANSSHTTTHDASRDRRAALLDVPPFDLLDVPRSDQLDGQGQRSHVPGDRRNGSGKRVDRPSCRPVVLRFQRLKSIGCPCQYQRVDLSQQIMEFIGDSSDEIAIHYRQEPDGMVRDGTNDLCEKVDGQRCAHWEIIDSATKAEECTLLSRVHQFLKERRCGEQQPEVCVTFAEDF